MSKEGHNQTLTRHGMFCILDAVALGWLLRMLNTGWPAIRFK
jgi:hypothetical protein